MPIFPQLPGSQYAFRQPGHVRRSIAKDLLRPRAEGQGLLAPGEVEQQQIRVLLPGDEGQKIRGNAVVRIHKHDPFSPANLQPPVPGG